MLLRSALLLTCLFLAGPARGGIIEYAFTLEVTEILAPTTAPGWMDVGDAVSGTIRFDTATPAEPPQPGRLDDGVSKATYVSDQGATIAIPGHAFAWEPAEPPFLRVYDGHVCVDSPITCFPERDGPTDALDFGADLRDAVAGVSVDVSLRITQTGAMPDMLGSIALPTTAPSLELATSTGGRITLTDDSGDEWWGGVRVTALSASIVPEPGSPLLFVLAAAMLRRRRRR